MMIINFIFQLASPSEELQWETWEWAIIVSKIEVANIELRQMETGLKLRLSRNTCDREHCLLVHSVPLEAFSLFSSENGKKRDDAFQLTRTQNRKR